MVVLSKRTESLRVIASTIKVGLCVKCYTTNTAVVKESKSTYKSKLKCVLCENGQNNGSLIVVRNHAKMGALQGLSKDGRCVLALDEGYGVKIVCLVM